MHYYITCYICYKIKSLQPAIIIMHGDVFYQNVNLFVHRIHRYFAHAQIGVYASLHKRFLVSHKGDFLS